MLYQRHRMKGHFILISFLFLTACSLEKRSDDAALRQSTEQQLRELTQQLTEAEISDDLPAFLKYCDTHTLSMPEYQLTLSGVNEIEVYYHEIFKRQSIRSFQREADEFIHMGNNIAEIGTFKKAYIDSNTDSLVTLNGKYWHIWEKGKDGVFKLNGEAFGYFNPVAHAEDLVVPIKKEQPDESEILSQKEIPLELKAYNALMEKGVRTRNGTLRSAFFTDDARIFPFADSTVSGIEKIKPYLISYSSRGTVTIDSIMCYTYDFKYSDTYVLEYDMFKVKWSRPDLSGRTEGKGIRIWKRQSDHSLALYREIGTHNFLQ
jgi:ketosteroid isomerase-like protein